MALAAGAAPPEAHIEAVGKDKQETKSYVSNLIRIAKQKSIKMK